MQVKRGAQSGRDGAVRPVPLQGRGSAVPAAVPVHRALSDSFGEQSSIAWGIKGKYD